MGSRHWFNDLTSCCFLTAAKCKTVLPSSSFQFSISLSLNPSSKPLSILHPFSLFTVRCRIVSLLAVTSLTDSGQAKISALTTLSPFYHCQMHRSSPFLILPSAKLMVSLPTNFQKLFDYFHMPICPSQVRGTTALLFTNLANPGFWLRIYLTKSVCSSAHARMLYERSLNWGMFAVIFKNKWIFLKKFERSSFVTLARSLK